MSDDERRRWDRRYAEGSYTPRADPSPFLERWLDVLPRGRALDIAAGTGRHTLRLARAGFEVDAVDISEVAMTRCREEAERQDLSVRCHVLDLDDEPLPGERYDLITVFRYRNPALWPRLRQALAPGGWILVEHHLQTQLDAHGPDSDAFRLAPGELLEAFADLRLVHYDERVEPADLGPGGRFVIARFAAVDGDPGW